MLVSQFIDVLEEQQLTTGKIVHELIFSLFFGNRPQSVEADTRLTDLFTKAFNVQSNPNGHALGSCIILTNPDVMTEEQKAMAPRIFVQEYMDSFEIALQLL